ncbi:MAG: hypothetical protein DHS20C11_19390 [Lysobacteraceae bacterium]|nr:MAG: hypothetical protein DHS20C11_19390 [Xanthomonadaceae bacterium]
MVKVRPAQIADLPTLLEFEQGIIAAERPLARDLKSGHINYYDLEQLIQSDSAVVAVAETEGRLVGSGYAKIIQGKSYAKNPRRAYLGFMYVDPALRGQAINQTVLDFLEQWSRDQGIKELVLEVYNGNQPALRAYEKAGFAKNLIQMRKEL